MRQFKLTCCGAILTKIPHACHTCGETTFLAEELDKEEQVITMGGYSGDKQKETRPWGSFENLLDEKGYKVKRIIVNPKQRLSLQLHQHRSEYWHILSGEGRMQLGDRDWIVSSGDAIEIDKLEVHRITNECETPLVILELQTGDCKENDIIRIEDDYGRLQ